MGRKSAGGREFAGVVGEVLKIRRQLAGFTQAELSREVGVGQSFVSMVENGSRTCSLDALARVANALGTKLSSIMKDAENIMGGRVER